MPYRHHVDVHGPVTTPTVPELLWRLTHHYGPTFEDDAEYTVTRYGDGSIKIRRLAPGDAEINLPAAVVRSLSEILREIVAGQDEPVIIRREPSYAASQQVPEAERARWHDDRGSPVRDLVGEADPELERLLREEEEIERQAAVRERDELQARLDARAADLGRFTQAAVTMTKELEGKLADAYAVIRRQLDGWEMDEPCLGPPYLAWFKRDGDTDPEPVTQGEADALRRARAGGQT